MGILVNLILLVFFYTSTLYAQTNLCYFSLNNEKEYHLASDFLKQINPLSQEKISISEYQVQGSNPQDSFLEMVNSNAKCDGLVISGHHTGSFGGKRASGSLGINFLEELSCEDESEEFFENLSAVWLQGCRTMGVQISAEEYEDFREDPDFHTNRLDDLLEEDHLDQSLEEVNLEFSDVLDQDNPLSTRYLRVFPNATLFGWTKTAPGVKAKSEKSLPYHIAHISRILNPKIKEYFMNPIDISSKKSKRRYAEILVATLNRAKPGQYVLKNRITEETLIDGWLEHGQAIGNFPYSFNNPDLMAYKSIASGKPLLLKAKKLGCKLQKSQNSKEKLILSLNEILKSKKMIFYNLNRIKSLMIALENRPDFRDSIRQIISSSQKFYEVLFQKLTNKELGVSRKLEYYYTYTKIVGKRNHRFEKSIKNKAYKLLLKTDGSLNYNTRDYKITLLKKLAQYKIIDYSFINKLTPSLKSYDVVKTIPTLIFPMLYKDEFKIHLDLFLKSNHFSDKMKFKYIEYIFDEYNYADITNYSQILINYYDSISIKMPHLYFTILGDIRYLESEAGKKTIYNDQIQKLVNYLIKNKKVYLDLSKVEADIFENVAKYFFESPMISNNLRHRLEQLNYIAENFKEYSLDIHLETFLIKHKIVDLKKSTFFSKSYFLETMKKNTYDVFLKMITDGQMNTAKKIKSFMRIINWGIEEKLPYNKIIMVFRNITRILEKSVIISMEDKILVEKMVVGLSSSLQKTNNTQLDFIDDILDDITPYLKKHGDQTGIFYSLLKQGLENENVSNSQKASFLYSYARNMENMKVDIFKLRSICDILINLRTDFFGKGNSYMSMRIFDSLFSPILNSNISDNDKKKIFYSLVDKYDEILDLYNENKSYKSDLSYQRYHQLLILKFSIGFSIEDKLKFYNTIPRRLRGTVKGIISKVFQYIRRPMPDLEQKYLSLQTPIKVYEKDEEDESSSEEAFVSENFKYGYNYRGSVIGKNSLNAIVESKFIINKLKIFNQVINDFIITDDSTFSFIYAIINLELSKENKFKKFEEIVNFFVRHKTSSLHQFSSFSQLSGRERYLRSLLVDSICFVQIDTSMKMQLIRKIVNLSPASGIEFFKMQKAVNRCSDDIRNNKDIKKAIDKSTYTSLALFKDIFTY